MFYSIHDNIACMRKEGDVEGLITILDANLPIQARSQASHALGMIGDTRAVPALVHHLSDNTKAENKLVSRFCKGVLMLMGESAVPLLCDEITPMTG
jgi:HEAT repeat protein